MINPGRENTAVRLGRIYFHRQEPQGAEDTPYTIETGEQEYLLEPGETVITAGISIDALHIVPPGTQPEPPDQSTVPANPLESVLFFLEYNHAYGHEPLRFEGEIFSHKTGINRDVPSASNRSVRFFSPGIHQPGFLSYGPAVPFGRGFLVVDFHISAENFKTRIKPVCQMDIFSYEDNGPLAQGSIKPADFKKNDSNRFRLAAVIPDTRTLEFRVQAGKYADISLDYVDVTYYQGVLVPLEIGEMGGEKLPGKE